ncbi:MAG: hypothetical protein CM15mP125_3990 [Gammaproteobacteria bacterium]|nr:MAG: hypothetical protein CM15mP125_3990 [Gammaproteobacteria bacterium]
MARSGLFACLLAAVYAVTCTQRSRPSMTLKGLAQLSPRVVAFYSTALAAVVAGAWYQTSALDRELMNAEIGTSPRLMSLSLDPLSSAEFPRTSECKRRASLGR